MGDFNYADTDGQNNCAENPKRKPVAGGERRLDPYTAC